MKRTVTVYGPGGHDPSKPDNNVVDTYEVDVPEQTPDPRDAKIAEHDVALAGVMNLLGQFLGGGA